MCNSVPRHGAEHLFPTRSGIGRAVAVLFAREGAQVAIVFLPVEKSDAAETQRAVQREGQAACCCRAT